MIELKHFKLESAPSTWEPDSIYYIKNGSIITTYITDTNGNPFATAEAENTESIFSGTWLVNSSPSIGRLQFNFAAFNVVTQIDIHPTDSNGKVNTTPFARFASMIGKCLMKVKIGEYYRIYLIDSVTNMGSFYRFTISATGYNFGSSYNTQTGDVAKVSFFPIDVTLFTLDEDNMISNSANHLATQQSIKAYVDSIILAGGATYVGGYDASTNTPDLDTAPSGIDQGDMYTVTVAGTFFTTDVEVGDLIIAEQNNPTLEAHWTIVNKNLDAASIKVAYESNVDTNAFTDAEQTKLSGIEANADVTDSTNVDAAGATMNTDTDVSANDWVLDEDDMSSDSNTKVPTQQSVRAFVKQEKQKFNIDGVGSSYTLSSIDDGQTTDIIITSASAQTLTIVQDSVYNFPIGKVVTVTRNGTGSVTIVAGTGATVNNAHGLVLSSQYSVAAVKKVAANTWIAYGDLTT